MAEKEHLRARDRAAINNEVPVAICRLAEVDIFEYLRPPFWEKWAVLFGERRAK